MERGKTSPPRTSPPLSFIIPTRVAPCTSTLQEPFKTTFIFPFRKKKKNSGCLWWKVLTIAVSAESGGKRSPFSLEQWGTRLPSSIFVHLWWDVQLTVTRPLQRWSGQGPRRRLYANGDVQKPEEQRPLLCSYLTTSKLRWLYYLSAFTSNRPSEEIETSKTLQNDRAF